MSRPFALVTVSLTALTAFIIGLSFSGWGASFGGAVPASAGRHLTAAAPAQEIRKTEFDSGAAELEARTAESVVQRPADVTQAAGMVNFADVAERINPAVVNIEATTRSAGMNGRRRREPPELNPQG